MRISYLNQTLDISVVQFDSSQQMKKIEKYDILDIIGRGAMGVVYKGFHPHLKKYVAIKEIVSEGETDSERRQVFEQEAAILAKLPGHPNIVAVRDAFHWEGKSYLVMDYIEGPTLGELVKEGGVEAARGVGLLGQVLSGVSAIHVCGIIHRDLKPSNILLDREGRAYITDFGIAEVADRLSRTKPMLTAKYAAPEVIDPALSRGGSERQIDLYAVGMLAYEMLLGANRFHRAFHFIYNADPHGAPSAWLNWHTDLRQRAPSLHGIDPGIPISLAMVVERLMAKDVNERYKDADDARRDLASWQGQPQPHAHAMSPSSDDATVPLEKLRRQRGLSTDPHSPPPSPPPKRASLLDGIPHWALYSAGAAVLLALVFLVPLAMQRNPGFSVTITGLPANSAVLVGGARRGIPVILKQDNDTDVSAIRVYGLREGEHSLSVSCPGGAVQLRTDDNQPVGARIFGRDGQEIILRGGSCRDPQAEIEYKGKMRLVMVKGGAFWMGDDQGQPNERPAHIVNLDYDYYLDKFEVSNGAYREFSQIKGLRFPDNPSWDKDYDRKNDVPAVGVSWHDAQAYCEWVDKQLPTEAEWEKAASWDAEATGPDRNRKRSWPWGNNPTGGHANFGGGLQKTTPVGQENGSESAYGISDLAGNVAEWTKDDYKAYPGNTTPDPNYGSVSKVVRGGSFNSGANEIRTTKRFYFKPEFSAQDRQKKDWLIGFRCAVRRDDPKLQQYLQRAGQSSTSTQ